MEKVIIITRTQGYIENGVPTEGREEFANAILNNHNIYTDNYLRKFLAAIKYYAKSDNVRTLIGDKNEGYEEISIPREKNKDDIIKIFLEAPSFPKDKHKIGGKCCYASFSHKDKEQKDKEQKDKEIILVLWDELNGIEDKNVDCFELFIEQICKDCQLAEDGNNYLYIHDKQFTGKQSGDEILLDKTICQSGSETNSQETSNEYKYLKKWFKYVALFAHDNNNKIGFFKNILQFRFGSPFIVDQRDAERNSNTFSELREKSDNIVEQYKERYQLKN